MRECISSALLYDGWVFYERWDRTRQMERQRAEKEAESARRALELMGGVDLKILNFYAMPSVLRAGERTRLCYSVVNAKRVRLEPPVKKLYPALSYCWEVAPRQSTQFKLVEEDDAGHSATESLTLKVTR